MTDLIPHSQPDHTGSGSLEGEQLSVGYGQTLILDHVDFQLNPGKLTVLLGPNGSGKSTLLRALARTLSPRSGRVLLDGQDIRSEVASDRYVGGMLDRQGGHIHPLNLALGEALAVEHLGGRIFEQSPAIKIERGQRPMVRTPEGQVSARFVVVAGNAYLGNLVPELAAKSMPCGTQVIATEPLAAEIASSLLPHDYCVEDCNYLLDYYRLSADRRLIYGGGVVYGARDPADVISIIRPKMLATFPQLREAKIEFAWTGNFLLTLSRLPQVGRLGDNIYYSQGCSGHGVTYTHLAGRIIAEAIKGQAERFDAFASLRHYPFPGGQRFGAPISALGALYYSLRDRLGF